MRKGNSAATERTRSSIAQAMPQRAAVLSNTGRKAWPCSAKRTQSRVELQKNREKSGRPAQPINGMDAPGPFYRFRWVKILYGIAALVPFLVLSGYLYRIFTTPNPSGYDTPHQYLAYIFENHPMQVFMLALNLCLYLLVCGYGLYVFSSRWETSGKETLLAASCILIWTLQQPAVFGMETTTILFGLPNHWEVPSRNFLYGVLQPQCLLTLATMVLLLLADKKKNARLGTSPPKA